MKKVLTEKETGTIESIIPLVEIKNIGFEVFETAKNWVVHGFEVFYNILFSWKFQMHWPIWV